MALVAIMRDDLDSAGPRTAAAGTRDVKQFRRLLALAMALDGHTGLLAAQAGGMDRQTLRDWVHRYNAHGVEGYSPAAVMDAYEVLRELIDGTEDTPGLFTALLAGPDLVNGEPRRALSQYAALQMRVWPDVRPGDRQNPVAPLVWLSA